MKKQYIAPSLFVVKLEMHSTLMQMSVYENEINGEDAGLSREYNIENNENIDNNRGSIWDNAW